VLQALTSFASAIVHIIALVVGGFLGIFGIFGIVIIGLGLGFLAIIFIQRTSPPIPGPNDIPMGGDIREHAWLGRMGAEQFSELLSMLFEELKFEVEKNDFHTTEGTVDLFAVNRTPITGGRIYVRGICLPADQDVGEDEIRIAMETARAEMAGKAIVCSSGGFTGDARASASGNPIDLLDGPELLRLVKKHLPPIAVAHRV
jgi:hypothetical protein